MSGRPGPSRELYAARMQRANVANHSMNNRFAPKPNTQVTNAGEKKSKAPQPPSTLDSAAPPANPQSIELELPPDSTNATATSITKRKRSIKIKLKQSTGDDRLIAQIKIPTKKTITKGSTPA